MNDCWVICKINSHRCIIADPIDSNRNCLVSFCTGHPQAATWLRRFSVLFSVANPLNLSSAQPTPKLCFHDGACSFLEPPVFLTGKVTMLLALSPWKIHSFTDFCESEGKH